VNPPQAHEGARGLGDQIRRYRTAFIAVLAMIVGAAFVGGYILAHERIALPSWVPVLGKSYYTLKGEFQTAQAVAPGQGQAVTIAGAKIGEIASVELHNGDALVTMHVTPKYGQYIHRDATMLLRPKTQLKDMTVEVDPGTPAAGSLPSGSTLPLSQTAPDINFDEFLAGLDAETRTYLQELLAGAGEGLKNNAGPLAATLKRFDPTARDIAEITRELQTRHANIARAIHNFQLLMNALGSKDTQLAELVDASNAVFTVFAQENQAVQSTLHQLPAVLNSAQRNLGKLATAAGVLGPTLQSLEPFAKSLAPGQQAAQRLFKTTTPIFKNQIRPFARQALPVVNQISGSLAPFAQAAPDLATSFSVLNEFFNELAYNPGPNQGGFLFFLAWANHNFNSVFSNADANSPLGQGLTYFSCQQLFLLPAIEKVNPTLHVILSLLHAPAKSTCSAAAGGRTASAASRGGSSLNQLANSVFGGAGAFTPLAGRVGAGG